MTFILVHRFHARCALFAFSGAVRESHLCLGVVVLFLLPTSVESRSIQQTQVAPVHVLVGSCIREEGVLPKLV